MSTGKTSILPRDGESESTDHIADWLNSVAKQDTARTGAFRRTLDSLLGG